MKNFLKYIEEGIRQYEEGTKVGQGKVPVYVKDPGGAGTGQMMVIGFTSKQATSIGAIKVSKDAYPGRKARAEKTSFNPKQYTSGPGWLVTHT
jgi:hypothetical protein